MRALAIAMTFAVSSCGAANGTRTTVTVFAAASLTEAFTEIGSHLADHDVSFNFGASSTLAEQIRGGASADVFASADEASMDRVADVVDAPRSFARNRLAIVTPADADVDVSSLADLADDELVVVLCAAAVPCGRLADRALASAGVTVEAASREQNVKAVLTKVRLGEADAGIVYASDVVSADGDVRAVAIGDEHGVTTAYPIAVVEPTGNRAGAEAFVALVLSARGRRILGRHGFLPAG